MVLSVSYLNCRGFQNSVPDISDYLTANSLHILALQETWLAKQELHLLNAFENYDSFGVSKTDYESCLSVGRNSGGVAILWNRCLNSTFTIRPYDCGHDWLVGLDLTHKTTNVKYSIINVYLPYNSPENVDKYVECLGALQQIVEEMDTTRFMLCGDFNCDPRKTDAFGITLSSFLSDLQVSCLDMTELPQDTFTYVSDCWNTTSWLDHCVCTADLVEVVSDLSVDYGVTWSDHRPTILVLDCSSAPLVSKENQLSCVASRVNWNDQNVVSYYSYKSDDKLDIINVEDLASCRNTSCTNVKHLQIIEDTYDKVVSCLNSCTPSVGKRHFTPVAGWNDYVKDWKAASRESFLLWVDAGRPRVGPEFELMKSCKTRFKYALRQCRRNEETHKANALAEKMLQKRYDIFWKEVKFVNSAKVSLPNNIGNVSGPNDIANMWKDHYCKMFNLFGDRNVKTYDCAYSNDIIITEHEIRDCIKALPSNKSPGPDGLVSEHFKYASPKLHAILAALLTSMLSHGFMPKKLIESVLVPIVKNKCKSLSSKDNYRPIALSNCLTKVIERILICKIDCYLWTLPNQFGFKKDQGTEQCIYVFKELVNSYLQSGSAVYCCFLDASKAFDRVNHDRLFNILLERGVPSFIVRLMDFWYLNQTMYVRWGTAISNVFQVKNGVRQGGVLSPLLFNLYINDLSINLKFLNFGLSYGSGIINHIIYADDIVLFSPTAGGLQCLIDVCEQFSTHADIIFNCQKSVCMSIFSGSLVYSTPEFHLGNTKLSLVNEVKYLGHVLTSNFSDCKDMDRQLRSLYCRSNMLIRRFGSCSDLVKSFLFKSFCGNMYCCSLWLKYPRYKLNRLFVAYNNSVRRLLCLPMRCSASLMYTVTNIPSPKCIISKTSFSLHSRVQSSKHIFVSKISGRSVLQPGSFAAHWLSLYIC